MAIRPLYITDSLETACIWKMACLIWVIYGVFLSITGDMTMMLSEILSEKSLLPISV